MLPASVAFSTDRTRLLEKEEKLEHHSFSNERPEGHVLRPLAGMLQPTMGHGRSCAQLEYRRSCKTRGRKRGWGACEQIKIFGSCKSTRFSSERPRCEGHRNGDGPRRHGRRSLDEIIASSPASLLGRMFERPRVSGLPPMTAAIWGESSLPNVKNVPGNTELKTRHTASFTLPERHQNATGAARLPPECCRPA